VWEAVLTFLFFPALIIMAFLTDRKFFASKWRKYRFNQRRVVVAENVTEEEGAHFPKGFIEAYGDVTIGDKTKNNNRQDKLRNEKRENNLDISIASAALKSHSATLKGANKNTIRKFAAYDMLKNTPKSRALYYINAIRRLTGSRGILPVKPQLDKVNVSMSSFDKLMYIT